MPAVGGRSRVLGVGENLEALCKDFLRNGEDAVLYHSWMNFL